MLAEYFNIDCKPTHSVDIPIPVGDDVQRLITFVESCQTKILPSADYYHLPNDQLTGEFLFWFFDESSASSFAGLFQGKIQEVSEQKDSS